MLPLLLLLAGGAITAYAFSPKVKTRVDEFVRAITSAATAHKEADANLSRATAATAALQATQDVAPTSNAAVVPQLAQGTAQTVATALQAATSWAQPFFEPAPQAEPSQSQQAVQETYNTAVDYAATAMDAIRRAAKETASAAMNAETPEQRQAVAESATMVLERKDQIDEALSTLGVGACDVQTYERVTSAAKDALLGRLSAEGMTVTGENPWDIDTGTAGVKLRAVWDPRSNVLKLIVSDKWRIVPCEEVWKRIDPKMKEVVGAWNAWR